MHVILMFLIQVSTNESYFTGISTKLYFFLIWSTTTHMTMNKELNPDGADQKRNLNPETETPHKRLVLDYIKMW